MSFSVLKNRLSAYDKVMLKLEVKQFHTVRAGQTLRLIAQTYKIPERALARENGLTEEPSVGTVLKLPAPKGDYYTVQAGDNRTLLCGSKENYEKKNGGVLYPQMKVWL